jgi:hypothetical protein
MSKPYAYTVDRRPDASHRRSAQLAHHLRPRRREYDDEFKRHLIVEIINAIAKASIVTDPDLNVMALRVSETLEALSSVIISFAALSPHFDTPSHLREFAEMTAKRIRRDVAKARSEGGLGRDFIVGAQRQ